MRLLAISDLHLGHRANREALATLGEFPDDWLIVAGDVGESAAHLELALRELTPRFQQVLWTPGNHELWSPRHATERTRGEPRYDELVEICRRLGAISPEDPYPRWPDDPDTFIAPMFLLYDYTFRPDGALTKEQGLELAYDKGIVCRDEALLHPDPHASIEEWCWARIEATQRRLAARDPALPVVFLTHYPLVREPTRVLRYPLFAQWCGTTLTSDWHLRFNAAAVVYGHLHIPRVTWYDGVRFEEVSLGYPREWRRRNTQPAIPREIMIKPGA